ncbi:MAG: hypothetical protein Q8Q18_01065 [bacterium]|nr:hypothetical protein [bacterium]
MKVFVPVLFLLIMSTPELRAENPLNIKEASYAIKRDGKIIFVADENQVFLEPQTVLYIFPVNMKDMRHDNYGEWSRLRFSGARVRLWFSPEPRVWRHPLYR